MNIDIKTNYDAEELYRCIIADYQDIYDVDNHYYIFSYNDAGAICYYTMYPEELLYKAVDAVASGENYIGAMVGVGGQIIDDPEEAVEFLNSVVKRYVDAFPGDLIATEIFDV